MKRPIVAPQPHLPRKDPVNPCPCQERPVDLTVKKGVLFWLKEVGESVSEGEPLCEGEAAKQVLEFAAPVGGVLAERCIEDEEVFSAGDILGYIETDE